MKSIEIPINGTETTIESQHCFVFVGANGSGKSRLGAWLEMHNVETVLRISAQRALEIPESVIIKSEADAWNYILYGHEKEKNKGYKWKWGKNYTTQLVNDYENVLASIFARMTNEHKAFFALCREYESRNESNPHTPDIISDKIIDIWNAVFPHRTIVLEDAKIIASVIGGNHYHAKDMSDGERVAIYLIGQCLVAPDGITLVIDEPEIHLHKSIMHKLWDKIEEYCPNNTFVYITHDLDFAASRKESTKIWLKSYDKENDSEQWDIEILNRDDDIPDSLLIEVLGNRKNVLFIEGEKGSYDYQLYAQVYKDYYVIPRKNCRTVIESTKAFNGIKALHNLEIKGLIDRDYMTDGEIESYKKESIYTLDVAEVENLYCIEELLRIVASYLVLNEKETVEKVKSFVFEVFEKEYDLQLASMCEKEIKHKLNCYNKGENTLQGLKNGLSSLTASIDIDKIYNDQNKKSIKFVMTKTTIIC